MTATLHRISQVQHDLKHSSYFRAWAILWFVVFIIFWVGFGMFASHVGQSSSLYASGFSPLTKVDYPTFHFRLEGWHNASMAINYNSVSCVWNHTINLAISPCIGYPNPVNGLANCFAVQTHNSTFSAYGRALEGSRSHGPDPHDNLDPPPQDLFGPTHMSSFIWCNFTVNVAALGTTPNWVAWELEGMTNYGYGDNAYSPIYFAPFALSQVLLEKFTIDGTEYWNRDHIYIPDSSMVNNTGVTNPLYLTGTALATTTVSTYQQFGLGYHSWNCLADIGGLAFSLWIMHIVVMIFVGLFFENDSEFLNGPAVHHSSPTTGGKEPTERTNLVY